MKLRVLIPLPVELAEQFPDDTKRGAPHVTVLFSEVDADPGVVWQAIGSALNGAEPVDVQLGGAVEILDGGERPAAVLPIERDLALRILRLRLRAALTDAGVDTPQTHDGYRPHATIRYQAPGGELPTELPAGRATCSRVEVGLDDQVKVVELGEMTAQLAALRLGADLQAEADRRLGALEVPEGWVVGRPFRCAATGEIYNPWTGAQRGRPITREGLEDAIAILEAGEDVGIDENHDVEKPGGAVLAAWLVDDGDRHSLAVLPAYGPRMARYIADSSGFLWSSPEFVWTDVADARTGQSVGSLKFHSLAITHDPAQSKRVLDRVRLANDAPPRGDDPEDPPEDTVDQEMRELLAAIVARLEAIEAKQAAGEQMAGEEPEEAAAAEQMAGEDPKAPAAAPAAAAAPEAEKLSNAAATAEIARLRAQLAKTTTEKLQAERAGAISELLTSGRLTPAEKAAANAVFDKGGRELLSTVYGSRPAGSVVPKTKGHGGDGLAAAGGEWAQLHQEATALVKERNDSNYTYDIAVRERLAQRKR